MSQEMMQGGFGNYPSYGNGEDVWGAETAAPTAARQSGQDPLDRVRRLLRGRMVLAVVAGILGAGCGAVLGYFSQEPVWRTDAAIKLQPFLPRLSGSDQIVPLYKQFMITEATEIMTPEMAQRAIRQPVWQQALAKQELAPVDPTTFATFVMARDANPEDFFLNVRVEHENPQLVKPAAEAVLLAYQERYDEMQKGRAETSLGAMERKIDALTKQIAETEKQIAVYAKKYGTEDLQNQQNDRLGRLAQLKAQLQIVETDLQQAVGARDRAADPEALTLAQLAEGDPQLSQLIAQKAQLENARSLELIRGMGPKSQPVELLESQINFTQEQIQAQAEETRKVYFGVVPDLSGNGGMKPVYRSTINQLEQNKAYLEERVAETQAEVDEINTDRSSLEAAMRDRQRLMQQREALIADRDAQVANGQLRGEFNTIELQMPTSVQIAKDRRTQMALGGAIMGFGFPVGLILLMGLLDSRFRYSDDTTDVAALSGVGGVPLLGILPNLPDRLSDPQQASIAAHCVHQVRTMLQLSAGNGPHAYAITSAGRSDGKTSLALALGLSYAASGCRTLLIDTDLLHGGLSNRLHVDEKEGVLDAVTGGKLLDHVCDTDVQDLALLPIGQAGPQHAGVFSPIAMRHLIEVAKQHYDVVLVDTGPVLGSIESTPAAAAVDGTILMVSRGQSRPMVNKVIKHLAGVGAKVAGLVFNRAQASDFQRSMSGMNLRSGRVAGRLTNGTNGGVGPVAKAMTGNGRN